MLSEEGKPGKLGEEERVRKDRKRGTVREKKEMRWKQKSNPQIKRLTAEN